MKFIVALDLQNGIAKGGNQHIFIPQDLKLFQNLTQNKMVLMGRKTFENLPNKKPLPNRLNVVLTNNKNYKADNCIVINQQNDLEDFIKKHNNEIWIIGGAEIYNQFIDKCEQGYITLIHKNLDCDVKINKLDKTWVKKGDAIIKGHHNGIYFETFKYIKEF